MSDTIDIGDGHTLAFASYQDDPRTGANVIHTRPDGSICQGWISFRGGAWDRAFKGGVPSWDVVEREPLTLSPSILCRACGDHGYVRGGKWVRA